MLRMGSSIHDPEAMRYFSSGTGLEVDRDFRCRLPPMLVPMVLLLVHTMLWIQYDKRPNIPTILMQVFAVFNEDHSMTTGLVRLLIVFPQFTHWPSFSLVSSTSFIETINPQICSNSRSLGSERKSEQQM